MKDKQKYSEMFKPIKIRNIEIKNRLAMAPITTNYSQGGYVTDQQIAFFAARAKGGAGLIVLPPASYPFPGYQAHVLLTFLFNQDHLVGWNELAETIHAFGAKAFVQVTAGTPGRQMRRGSKTKAPSPLPVVRIPPENMPRRQVEFETRRGLSPLWEIYNDGPVPEELTIEEIKWIEDAQATVVRLLKVCGFDGAELHFCHGYLGHNFLSQRNNIRLDEYGGNFENRTRFFRNTVIKARLQAGPDFIIGVRLTGDEHVQGGLEIEESTRIAKIGEELGLDYIHLTAGCWEAVNWYVPDEDGTMLPQAEAMKSTVKIPVITPAIHEPKKAEEAIKQGKTDMVSLCRPLVADPEWVNKVAGGQENKIKKCMRCHVCLRRTRNGLGIRCEVNRDVGQERYMPEYYRSIAPFRKDFYLPK